MSYTFESPFQYIPKSEKFGTVGLGKLYIGVINGNPASTPADRIQAYIARQGLSDLAISQPIDISAGGVPIYQGAPVTIKVNSAYSCAVLDHLGAQIYYSPKSGDEIQKIIDLEASAAALDVRLDAVEIEVSGLAHTVESFADLATTPASSSGAIVYVKKNVADGRGGDYFQDFTGVITSDLGSQITNTATIGHYWKRINDEQVSGYDFGTLEDGTADDSTALQAAAVFSKVVTISGVVKAPSPTLDKTCNTEFVGDNDFVYPKPYRKVVVPRSATADHLTSVDINPRKHLKQMNVVAKPVVGLVGDSLTAYLANSYGRADTLAETLHRTLETQFPNGVTFKNFGISGSVWGSALTNMYQSYIPWYAGLSGTAWLDVVKASAPDCIILSWGMNSDSDIISVADVKSVIDAIQAWPKVPSIVMVTCLVPSPRSASNPVGSGTTQENRDKAAGFVRSYAKFRNVGLLDLHRKFTMVRDGFDPLSGIMTLGDTVAPTTITPTLNHSVGTKKCYDWRAQVQIDGSLLSATKGVTFKVGSGNNDFIQLLRPSGTQLQLNMYSGQTLAIGYTSKIITYTLPTSTDYLITFEKVGNFISIYVDNDIQFGTYNEPIYFEKCVSLGGEYFPEVLSDGTASVYILKNAIFNYAYPKPNTPSVTDSLMFGNESGTNFYGGSGFNHPSGAIATHVYRPVIEGVCWTANIPLEGTQAVGVGVTSQAVTFVTQELNTNYRISLTESSGATSIGQRFWYGNKSTAGFTIYFAAATLNAGSIDWRLERY